MKLLKCGSKKVKETRKLVEDYLAEFDEVIHVQVEQCVKDAKQYASDAIRWAGHVAQYAQMVKDSESDDATIERAQWHAKWAQEHAKYAEATVEVVTRGRILAKSVVTVVKEHAKDGKAEKYISWIKDGVICVKNGANLVENLANSVKENSAWAKSYAEDAVRNSESINLDPTVEIRKYKSLLDDGIITEEEFDKKKAELLSI